MTREPVGVLGGTFDPVHRGHIHVAEGVRRALEIEKVLFVPSAAPPHKRVDNLTPAVHRVAMIERAIVGRRGLEISTTEIDRGGVSYTIETLRRLRCSLPAVAPLFILGTDALADIATWREHDALLAEFDLVVVDRPGADVDAARSALGSPHAARWLTVGTDGGSARGLEPALGNGGRVLHVTFPPMDVSSSAVRAVAASGGDLTRLVPAAVADYIQRRGLYGWGIAR